MSEANELGRRGSPRRVSGRLWFTLGRTGWEPMPSPRGTGPHDSTTAARQQGVRELLSLIGVKAKRVATTAGVPLEVALLEGSFGAEAPRQACGSAM